MIVQPRKRKAEPPVTRSAARAKRNGHFSSALMPSETGKASQGHIVNRVTQSHSLSPAAKTISSSDQDALNVLIRKILPAEGRGLSPTEVCQRLELHEPALADKYRNSGRLQTAIHVALNEMAGIDIERVDSALVGRKGAHLYVNSQGSAEGVNEVRDCRSGTPITTTPPALGSGDGAVVGPRNSDDHLQLQATDGYPTHGRDQDVNAVSNNGSSVPRTLFAETDLTKDSRRVIDNFYDRSTLHHASDSPKDIELNNPDNRQVRRAQSTNHEEPQTLSSENSNPHHFSATTPEIKLEICPQTCSSCQGRGPTPDRVNSQIRATPPSMKNASEAATFRSTEELSSPYMDRSSTQEAQGDLQQTFQSSVEVHATDAGSSRQGTTSQTYDGSSRSAKSQSQVPSGEDLSPRDTGLDSRRSLRNTKALFLGKEVVAAHASREEPCNKRTETTHDAKCQELIKLGRQVWRIRILRVECENYKQEAIRLNAQLLVDQTALGELIDLANTDTTEYNNLDLQHRAIQAQLLGSERQLMEVEARTRTSREVAKSKSSQCQAQRSSIERHLEEWAKKDTEYKELIRDLGLIIPGYEMQ